MADLIVYSQLEFDGQSCDEKHRHRYFTTKEEKTPLNLRHHSHVCIFLLDFNLFMRRMGCWIDWHGQRKRWRCSGYWLMDSDCFWNRSMMVLQIICLFSFQIWTTDFLMRFPIAMLAVLSTVTSRVTSRTCFMSFSRTMPALLRSSKGRFSFLVFHGVTYLGSLFLSVEQDKCFFECLSFQALVLLTFT